MSEKRRSKRAEDREAKSNGVRKKKFGTTVISIDDKKVVVATPYRKVTYMAGAMNPAYLNYSMLFEDDGEDNEEYAKILIGLEMIPNFAHTDAELASKIFSLFVESVGEKMLGVSSEETDDKTKEELEDQLDLVYQEISTMITE